ncbi:MAG: hypothetical protein ACLFR0_06850 [Alphaproteobacteria bacterium]
MKTSTKMTLGGAVFALAACGVNTSGNIDIDPTDIQYTQDPRTELCFAFVASRKTATVDTTGLGMANVPCTPEVLELTNQ